ncbi:rho GTPase-activating protein 30 isoform X2 [Chamaea fasciata]|uniref:rho GTPase-activating protein 30 isoform X2 n=1 Tax=Chamaea fasciata TaxID=190680 RepID=UPI00336A2E7C
MSLALKARQRARRKGGSRERLFGCDLREHLQRSGHDVPQVLRSCTEFVEQHGVVDGIYRLSGVSSNIQRLRQEFEAQRSPDLRRDVYLQDVHCVSSLCKAYCRELPNPLLTYQLYDKFADAVALQMEEARLVKIKEVLKELPVPHYRTLEFLMRHLLRMAGHSARTNMHARNLAIVWAPNLLRSRDIEAAAFNGTAAFMEVRVQSIVVEFILTHVEQLFGDAPLPGGDCPQRPLLLPGGVPPLSHGDGPPQMRPYHTIIELGEHRSKGSLKAKKWRSIFNLGRSGHEAKRKPGKAEEKEKGGKVTLRPAKSMDSLSSGPPGAPGADAARLLPKLSVKLRPQRQLSSDAAPAPPDPHPELDESLEESLEAAAESSTQSEPTTPKAPRAGPGACGRSRAEKCAGLHISGPFAVTVPLHITSNLSRLTRGLPCPALGRDAAPGSPPEPPRHPRPRSGDAEQSRLSLELRDSFAFLDGPETWLEGGGDAEAAARSPGTGGGIPGIGDGIPGIEDETFGIEDGTPGMEDGTLGIEDGTFGIEDGTPGMEDGTLGMEDGTPGMEEEFPAVEEGMESGFMNPGELWAEQPDSYLSIEECTEQDMFFLAPGASDPDSDPDEAFLSAHDELSPPGTPEGAPAGGTAPESQEIPEIPETPKIPKVLEVSEIPEILETPEIPETPEILETPEIPEILGTPETPEILETPEIPETPETPETPGIPGIPETPEIPEIPDTPETPEIPAQPPLEEDGPGVGDPPRDPRGAAGGDSGPGIGVRGEGGGVGGPAGNGGAGGGGSRGSVGSPPAPLPAEPPREPPREPPAPGGVPDVTPGVTPTSPSPPAPPPGAPPRILGLTQDQPPKILEPPRSPELIPDEPPRPPQLIQDEPPKIPELTHADPPKTLQPLELTQEEPPRVPEPPKSWDPPQTPGAHPG